MQDTHLQFRAGLEAEQLSELQTVQMQMTETGEELLLLRQASRHLVSLPCCSLQQNLQRHLRMLLLMVLEVVLVLSAGMLP